MTSPDPRSFGKYGPDGKPRAIPGHNIAFAAIGVLVLWIGWFGFNPGSTVAGNGDIGRVALVTNFGAVAGTLTAMFTAWAILKKPDASMTLNGALAGLVAITAPCDIVTPVGALIIGAVSGVLVVLSVLAIDRIGVDDPVGAISVHLVNGVWGTLAWKRTPGCSTAADSTPLRSSSSASARTAHGRLSWA